MSEFEKQASSLKGRVVLDLKADEFGNVTLYAPGVPVEGVVKIMIGLVIDLIFQSLEKKRIETVQGNLI